MPKRARRFPKRKVVGRLADLSDEKPKPLLLREGAAVRQTELLFPYKESKKLYSLPEKK